MAGGAREDVFVALVRKMAGRGSGFHFLEVPPAIAEAYRDAGIRRVIATMNGVPVRRALQRSRDGLNFLVVGLHILRDIDGRFDEPVMIHLTPDPDPDRIDLGEELEAVFEQDESAAERFFSFTPGRQRGYADYVTSAKRPETRIRRALELAHKLRTHTLYGDTRAIDE